MPDILFMPSDDMTGNTKRRVPLPHQEVDYYMKPLKNRVSITLDEDVIDRVKELAENDDRSFSQYINMVLRKWIAKTDSTRKP